MVDIALEGHHKILCLEVDQADGTFIAKRYNLFAIALV